MIEVIGILFLCYVLIGLEAIVPGGILGVLGFLGLFVAAYGLLPGEVFYLHYPTMLLGSTRNLTPMIPIIG